MNLLEDVYRTNHLIEFDKPRPQILKSSLKMVKAAKEVHQIGCFGDLLVNVGKGKKKIFPDPYEFREVEEVAASGPSLPATQPRPSTSGTVRVTRSSAARAPTAPNDGSNAGRIDWEEFRRVRAEKNKKKKENTIVEGKPITLNHCQTNYIPSPVVAVVIVYY